MRLIDADNLEGVVAKVNEQGFEISRYEFKRIELVIFEFPTIEAEPVRHGHWIDKKGDPFYNQCSECGAVVSAYLGSVFLDCEARDLHYCPNCGAFMR